MWCENCRKRFKKTDKYYKHEAYGIVFPIDGKFVHIDMAEEVFCSKQCALKYYDETNIKEVNGEEEEK